MDTADLQKIGERIRRQRRHLGMTQEELAEKMDVSVQMISNLERGVKAIRIDNLIRLSGILCVTADYILTGRRPSADADTLSWQIDRLPDEKRSLIEGIISYFLSDQ